MVASTPPGDLRTAPADERGGMRTTYITTIYWTLVALGLLAVAATGVDLAGGAPHPALGSSLAGLLPEPVLPLLAGVLSLVVAASVALAAPERRRGGGAPLLAGGLAALVLTLLTVSVELLAIVGYLPLALVMAPFHEGMRSGLATAVDAGIVTQVVVLAGVLLWTRTARQQLRTRAVPVPTWARPEAAARWGRVAVVVAVVPPLGYAFTRFSWMFYPLGFDREVWEAEQGGSALLPGVWLGSFAVVGALLTLGLTQRWGEVFPRWVPRIGGRRVPVALAVVPAGLVSLILVPAGISMIRAVFRPEAAFDPVADWAAYGPTLLWPLWGLALGAATLAYALRRRGEQAHAAGAAGDSGVVTARRP